MCVCCRYVYININKLAILTRPWQCRERNCSWPGKTKQFLHSRDSQVFFFIHDLSSRFVCYMILRTIFDQWLIHACCPFLPCTIWSHLFIFLNMVSFWSSQFKDIIFSVFLISWFSFSLSESPGEIYLPRSHSSLSILITRKGNSSPAACFLCPGLSPAVSIICPLCVASSFHRIRWK